jgi:hypothetical protein
MSSAATTPTMPPAHAFRVRAVLKDLLDKIDLLPLLAAARQSDQKQQQQQATGSQIEALASRQRELSARYRSLVQQRNEMAGGGAGNFGSGGQDDDEDAEDEEEDEDENADEDEDDDAFDIGNAIGAFPRSAASSAARGPLRPASARPSSSSSSRSTSAHASSLSARPASSLGRATPARTASASSALAALPVGGKTGAISALQTEIDRVSAELRASAAQLARVLNDSSHEVAARTAARIAAERDALVADLRLAQQQLHASDHAGHLADKVAHHFEQRRRLEAAETRAVETEAQLRRLREHYERTHEQQQVWFCISRRAQFSYFFVTFSCSS